MEEDAHSIEVRIAVPSDVKFVNEILEEMERSARQRGTGIAKRSPQAVCKKIYDGLAVIAVDGDVWVGFSYVQAWSDSRFVSNSGLIVNPDYRHHGVASMIKKRIISLCGELYPNATIFSITTGAAVMAMNHKLGFEPVTYEAITQDEGFWDQCKQCVNYPILQAQGRKRCLCTALVLGPEAQRQH